MSSDICKRTLCVKNLSQPSEKLINSLFSQFGMTSYKIITSTDTNRKDIEVEFESDDFASRARNAVHGKVIEGNNLFVDYALFTQSPLASSSGNKQQKQKGSVLDRIIKPGNSKNTEKTPNLEAQPNGKETSQQDPKNISNSSTQPKNSNDRKLEKAEPPSQSSIIKRNGLGEKGPESNVALDVKSHPDAKNLPSENVQSKKSFTTQSQDQSNQRLNPDGQRKLEIIKPKHDDSGYDGRNNDSHKEANVSIKGKSEAKQNDKNSDSRNGVRGNAVAKKSDKANEKHGKAINTDDHYGSNRKRTLSRSRSRSRDKSRSDRHPESNLHSKPKPYNQSNYRRPSRSRSHSRSPRSVHKGRSDSKPYNKDYPSYPNEGVYLGYRDSYSKDNLSHYRGSDRYKRSRSRSNHRREYSPYRDPRDRKEDIGYAYKDRSRSRQRTRSRSKGRGDYYKSRDRVSRSRSPVKSPYRAYDHGANKQKTYKPQYTTKGGLVIARLESPKRQDDFSIRDEERSRRRDFSRSLSKEGRGGYHPGGRRSRSRERRSQNQWRKTSSDYLRYKNKKLSKTPESNRNKKALDIRIENDVEKRQKQPKTDFTSDVVEGRSKGGIDENRQTADKKMIPAQPELPNINMAPANITEAMSMFANNANMYASFLTQQQPYLSAMFPPGLMNFPNPMPFCPVPIPGQEIPLPGFINPLFIPESREQSLPQNANMHEVDKTQFSSERNGGESVETAITQTNNHEKDAAINEAKEGGKLAQRPIREELAGFNNLGNKQTAELNKTATLGNSFDKKEELKQSKSSSLETADQLSMDAENDQSAGINLEFIKKNKLQAIINYMVSTGDVQGLKEKLKLLEKSK